MKPIVNRATGSSLTRDHKKLQDPNDGVSIIEFGALEYGDPLQNTRAINDAIEFVAKQGGGTVKIPHGRFAVYTILLKSNVNIFLSKDAVLQAARFEGLDHQALFDTTSNHFNIESNGIGGGNFQEPEINRYVGLQDHAHTYLHNSLILGVGVHDVVIWGHGRIDGSIYEEKTGIREEVLTYSDPQEPLHRNEHGHRNGWWGNKGIALVDCTNVSMLDFEMLLCGHFAIIATGCTNIYIDGLMIDSQRDGIDIDGCQDVTIQNCWCNTLHDDAIVVKASYGAQRFLPTHNILIQDCTVSGYDAGSVLAGNPTTDRQVAEGGCGPMGRVKIGTESTCGYSLITISHIQFEHCMGLAIEAVDCSDATDILAEHIVMNQVTSSPLYIRCADRGRFPVTGLHSGSDGQWVSPFNDVRYDNAQWILPNFTNYECHPARRFIPSYHRKLMTVDGNQTFAVVDPDCPVNINQANVKTLSDGTMHPIVWDDDHHEYGIDANLTLDQRTIAGFGNACGSEHIAQCKNIVIDDLQAFDVDPRYPIIIAGLMDAYAENIYLENIRIEYRGGLSLTDAAEQRILRTAWQYRESDLLPSEQIIPWLINPGHAHNESLLPRVQWNPDKSIWEDNPYNVPEGVSNYPDPDEFGILPAFGLYARHVRNLSVHNISVATLTPDERHVCVFDDVTGLVDGIASTNILCNGTHLADIVTITHNYKRRTNFEYVPDEPYIQTTTNLDIRTNASVESITINAPEPGTPPDTLYKYPTVATCKNGYAYSPHRTIEHLPQTVYMPYLFPQPTVQIAHVGEVLAIELEGRDPLDAYSSFTFQLEKPLGGMELQGAQLIWKPTKEQIGIHRVGVNVESHGRASLSYITIHVQ